MNEGEYYLIICKGLPLLSRGGYTSLVLSLIKPHNHIIIKAMSNKEEKRKAIRLLLLQAWRERWSDVEWGIHLKKIIPQGVSADSYDLSEIILSQALVGVAPNNLLLSYLKNAISGQIVLFATTLHNIISFDDISKPHCVKALFDIIISFVPLTCQYGCNEDPLALSKSLLKVIEWSLLISHKALLQIVEKKQGQEFVVILELMCQTLQLILSRDSLRALVKIAVMEEADTLRQIEQTESNVRGTLVQVPGSLISINERSNIDSSLKLMRCLTEVGLETQSVLNAQWLHNPCINALVHQETVLNPTGEIKPFVDQLLLVEKLQSLSRPVLICDVIRACFLGLIDAATGLEELKWVAFTFLKLPLILVKIQHQSSHGNNDLEKALLMLSKYTSLIDATESKYTNCDCLQLLIDLCLKNNLLNESQAQVLLANRTPIDVSKKVRPAEPSPTQPTPALIVRAEPTVTSILKTLDADYTKNQEALLGVLCHMMSGKSFELILAAAAATGKLRSFAIKLIKFNEFAKASPGEGSKASMIRALLFDISFLMLCHITQLYGLDIIFDVTEKDSTTLDSFFSQWASRCLPLDAKFKSIDAYKTPEQAKVDALLSQFNVGGELKTSLVKWFDACYNAPFAIQEVLYAWKAGAVDQDTVKSIMDNMKSRLCCFPVVVCAWLCSFINISNENDRKKPAQMTQMILSACVPEHSFQYYTERSHLMSVVVKRMLQDLYPTQGMTSTPAYLTKNMNSLDLLSKTLKQIFKDGCVRISIVHTLDQLINIGGVRWFCDAAVSEMLNHTHPEDLAHAVSIMIGIFHLNIEQLSLTFLNHTLPRLLQGSEYKTLLLVDPKGKALAQFTVLLIMSAVQMRQYSSGKCLILRRGTVQSCSTFTFEEQERNDDIKPAKQRKVQEEVLTLHSEGFNFDLIESKDEGDHAPTYDTKDALNKAIVKLFSLLSSIINEPVVSARNGFNLNFIREAVKCGPQYSRYIMQFIPATMTAQLLKSFPSAFSTDMLLRMSDLNTYRGRCIAANAVCQSHRQLSWTSQHDLHV